MGLDELQRYPSREESVAKRELVAWRPVAPSGVQLSPSAMCCAGQLWSFGMSVEGAPLASDLATAVS